MGHREDYWRDCDAYLEGDRYIADRDAMPYHPPKRRPVYDPTDEIIEAMEFEKRLRALARKRRRP